MALIKFPDFQNKSLLEDADYIVGYKADGSVEYKTTLSTLVGYMADYFEIRTPFLYNFAPNESFEFIKNQNACRIDWLGDVKFHKNHVNDTVNILNREKLIHIEIGLIDGLQSFTKPFDIDLSFCTSLSSALIYLNNDINSVNFSDCENLESLGMHQNMNSLTAINITNCPKLKYAEFGESFELRYVTQDDNQDTELENIDISSTRLLNTDFLSTKTKLKFVKLDGSDITILDISSSYGGIIYLNAQNSKLTQTNVENILIGIDNAQSASVTSESIPAPTGIGENNVSTYSILLNNPSSNQPGYPGGNNAAPISTAALNAKASLISKGWIVETA